MLSGLVAAEDEGGKWKEWRNGLKGKWDRKEGGEKGRSWRLERREDLMELWLGKKVVEWLVKVAVELDSVKAQLDSPLQLPPSSPSPFLLHSLPSPLRSQEYSIFLWSS